jgi:hypothetical protein
MTTPMASKPTTETVDEITEAEARLLEAYGPLQMARVIEQLLNELAWIRTFATVRSKDDSKTFSRVNRGALRNIAEHANSAIAKATGGHV